MLKTSYNAQDSSCNEELSSTVTRASVENPGLTHHFIPLPYDWFKIPAAHNVLLATMIGPRLCMCILNWLNLIAQVDFSFHGWKEVSLSPTFFLTPSLTIGWKQESMVLYLPPTTPYDHMKKAVQKHNSHSNGGIAERERENEPEFYDWATGSTEPEAHLYC